MVDTDTLGENAMRHVIHENNCEKCLFMKPASKIIKNNNVEIDIFLTLNFHRHIENITNLGELSVSLKCLELNLNLENAIAPYNKREFVKEKELELYISKQTKKITNKSNTNKDNNTIDFSLSSKESKGGTNVQSESQNVTGESNESSSTFDVIMSRVHSSGSEGSPSWSFETLEDETELVGLISNKKLCSLIPEETSSKFIRATFTTHVRPRDLILRGVSGIWPTKISGKKHSALQLVVYKYLNNKLAPYVSKSLLMYEAQAVKS